MNNEVYAKLKKPIIRGERLDTLDELRVRVGHQNGGVNYLSGNGEKGGVYLFLTPVHRGNGFISTTIDGKMHNMGYKILLKEMGRKSQKQIDLAADLIIPYSQQIADYYSEGQHEAVFNFVKKVYCSNK
jgi:hypothetical protein